MSFFKYHVFVCTNDRENGAQCCEQSGASKVRSYAKNKIKKLGMSGEGGIRFNTAGCLDRCAEGPVMVVYPEEIWYSYIDEKDVDEIIQSHLIEGEIVNRLRIK